jgi:isopenicillin N synthase-like dioxygenase
VVVPDQDGLEVLGRNGVWMPVPFQPGTLIVNLGDMMVRTATG